MTACVPWIKERPLLTVVTIALGIPFIDSPLRAHTAPSLHPTRHIIHAQIHTAHRHDPNQHPTRARQQRDAPSRRSWG
jgi:hypothetical protein